MADRIAVWQPVEPGQGRPPRVLGEGVARALDHRAQRGLQAREARAVGRVHRRVQPGELAGEAVDAPRLARHLVEHRRARDALVAKPEPAVDPHAAEEARRGQAQAGDRGRDRGLDLADAIREARTQQLDDRAVVARVDDGRPPDPDRRAELAHVRAWDVPKGRIVLSAAPPASAGAAACRAAACLRARSLRAT